MSCTKSSTDSLLNGDRAVKTNKGGEEAGVEKEVDKHNKGGLLDLSDASGAESEEEEWVVPDDLAKKAPTRLNRERMDKLEGGEGKSANTTKKEPIIYVVDTDNEEDNNKSSSGSSSSSSSSEEDEDEEEGGPADEKEEETEKKRKSSTPSSPCRATHKKQCLTIPVPSTQQPSSLPHRAPPPPHLPPPSSATPVVKTSLLEDLKGRLKRLQDQKHGLDKGIVQAKNQNQELVQRLQRIQETASTNVERDEKGAAVQKELDAQSGKDEEGLGE